MNLNKVNLRHFKQPLQNENGTAIISALLILMLLTIVSITATDTTTTEKRIVRSEAVFEQNFYLAESAAMEGVQRIQDGTTNEQLIATMIPVTDADYNNLIIIPDADNPDDDEANLDTNGDGVFDTNDTYQVTEIDPTTYRVVIQKDIPSGSSIGMGTSRLYDYLAYGYSEAGNGQVFIKVGVKKRF